MTGSQFGSATCQFFFSRSAQAKLCQTAGVLKRYRRLIICTLWACRSEPEQTLQLRRAAAELSLALHFSSRRSSNSVAVQIALRLVQEKQLTTLRTTWRRNISIPLAYWAYGDICSPALRLVLPLLSSTVSLFFFKSFSQKKQSASRNMCHHSEGREHILPFRRQRAEMTRSQPVHFLFAAVLAC